HPPPPLFPYTTLFRSVAGAGELPPGSATFGVSCFRSSAIGCENVSRLGDGSGGGFGGGTSCQRRRNSMSLAYSFPVRLARTRMRSEEHTSELQSRENL